jgi:protein TonB
MTYRIKRTFGLAGGLSMTMVLCLFLLAGTMTINAPETKITYGAVRLSSFTQESIQEETLHSTREVPQVKSLKKISMTMETALNEPLLDMELPSVDLEVTPEMAGTLPMSGQLSLARPAAVSAPSGGALTLGQVDEMPRPLYAPQPMYPAAEKARGVEQKEIKIRIRLHTDGTVAEAVPVDMSAKDKAFFDAALKAVSKWRFSPCRKGGKAVQCVADQPFSFTLSE